MHGQAKNNKPKQELIEGLEMLPKPSPKLIQTVPRSLPDPPKSNPNRAQDPPRTLQEPFWRAFPIQAPKNEAQKSTKRRQGLSKSSPRGAKGTPNSPQTPSKMQLKLIQKGHQKTSCLETHFWSILISFGHSFLEGFCKPKCIKDWNCDIPKNLKKPLFFQGFLRFSAFALQSKTA